MAADAVFEGIVHEVLHDYFNDLFVHVFVTGFFAWITTGLLRGIFLGKEVVVRNLTRPKELNLGGLETAIIVGLLDVLFLGFIFVQFRYFFAGTSHLAAYTKLSYAEYARRGFFELVTVAALILPLLLVMEWLLRKDSPGPLVWFRSLAALQVVFLFVIMASALQRMRLYRNEFGLTELRLYTTAFMGWLAVVFIWFLVTVLRGRRDRFAFGALVAGFLGIGILQFVNPDDLIVRTNLARLTAGRAFDIKYAVSLSADAMPALIDGLPFVNAQDRSWAATRILKRWTRSQQLDWRTWNLSRSHARNRVREREEELKTFVGLP